jgi:predicted DNA-binding transcriptional regulator AlpA
MTGSTDPRTGPRTPRPLAARQPAAAGKPSPATATRAPRERLWSHQEAAAYLYVEPAALYQLNSKGRGPRRYKVGRYNRYRKADLDQWLDDNCATR